MVYYNIIYNVYCLSWENNAKGYICFGYDVTEQEIRFYVTDTGEGIPDDQLERVFDRFVKLTQWTNGVGLGFPRLYPSHKSGFPAPSRHTRSKYNLFSCA